MDPLVENNEPKRRRPKSEKLVDMLPGEPFPLSKARDAQSSRVESLKYTMEFFGRLACALRALRLSSAKRFDQRSRNAAIALTRAESALKDLEDGVADCNGSDFMEREVYKSIMSRHGVDACMRSGPARGDTSRERARRFRQRHRARKRVERTRYAFDEETARVEVANCLRSMLSDVELLKDEIRASSGASVVELQRQLRLTVRDIRALCLQDKLNSL